MKYIKYQDFTDTLKQDEVLLMSHAEFINGGKNIKGVPVVVTYDGSEPKGVDEHEI